MYRWIESLHTVIRSYNYFPVCLHKAPFHKVAVWLNKILSMNKTVHSSTRASLRASKCTEWLCLSFVSFSFCCLIHLHITKKLVNCVETVTSNYIRLSNLSLTIVRSATERVEDKEYVWHWGLKLWKGGFRLMNISFLTESHLHF